MAEAVEDEPVEAEDAPVADEPDFVMAEAVEDEPVEAFESADVEVADAPEYVMAEAVEDEPLLAFDSADVEVADAPDAEADSDWPVETPSISGLEDPAYVEARWQAQAALSEILDNLHEVLEVASVDNSTVEEPAAADHLEDPALTVAETAPALETESLPVEWSSGVDEQVFSGETPVEDAAQTDATPEPEPILVEAEAEPATVEEEVAEPAVAEETAEPAVAEETAEPSVAEHDPEEDLWAAVLADTAEPAPSDQDEPDLGSLEPAAPVLRQRRVRRRIVRQTRRPQPQPAVADTPAPERSVAPPPPPPTVLEGPAELPAPPRTLRLPPVLPPKPPAEVTPWAMPIPPAYLPPPPPAMLSNVQPAPARFRPQISVAPEPVAMPTTRPCLKCGLELSARVAFCRRCGTRQTPA
jgi:hypothetical protein